jgi:hypothetical protein
MEKSDRDAESCLAQVEVFFDQLVSDESIRIRNTIPNRLDNLITDLFNWSELFTICPVCGHLFLTCPWCDTLFQNYTIFREHVCMKIRRPAK